MAGKDQHYDSRFLLKGFASKRSGKKVFTWYFEKGCAPRPESTKNIGNANLFYGSSDPDSLDTRITKKENYYSVIVDQVRKDKKIQPSDKDTLVEFVYFQGVRTRGARELYRSALVPAMESSRQELGNPEGMAQLIRNTLQPDNKDLQRAFREELKKYGRRLSYLQEQTLLRCYLRQHAGEFVEREASEQAFAVDVALSAHLEESHKLVKEAHNKALDGWIKKNSHEPGLGLTHYRQLQWSVQTLGDGSLILGDVAVLHREADSLQLSAGISGKASLVLLPLSHNLLLIGAADGRVRLPSLDDINRSSAELSRYFFVSNRCSQREIEYHKLTGKRAPTVEQE